MINECELKEFYKSRKVLITGHTGFKGAWLCQLLNYLGAEVAGYALAPPTSPSLFRLCNIEKSVHSYIGNITDLTHLRHVFEQEQPEIVIHMAAQPIVRESYLHPVETYETNVMGTVHVLECVRQSNTVKSLINVTTDKVYRNREWDKGYTETDYLDGYDPYSNSKSCSELVTHSYVQSFLQEREISVSTCRAGNVIGGGDFAIDRIIPDCVRAAETGNSIIVRNPYSTRPYQHVLEPLYVYLTIAMKQFFNQSIAGCYNVGPNDSSCITTGELVTSFCNLWNENTQIQHGHEQRSLKWIDQSDNGPHEANFLKLDCSKLKQTFQWEPRWNINEALQKVIFFECVRIAEQNDETKLINIMKQQIKEYIQNK